MKKTVTLSIALALGASLYADEVKTITLGMGTPGKDEPMMCGIGLSSDGKYVCGAFDQGIGIFAGSVETGEVKFEMCGEDGGELRNINNNGLALGINTLEESSSDFGMLYDYNTGEMQVLTPPNGTRYIIADDITNDNQIMVGSLSTATGTKAAYKYEGGQWIQLPYPSAEVLGPIADLLHKGDWSGTKKISGDGSVIYGYVGNFVLPCVWVRNERGGYDVDFFAAKYLKVVEEDRDNPDKPFYGLSAMYGLNLSNNGRYACMLGLIEDAHGRRTNVPAVYDVFNKTLKIYEPCYDVDPKGYGFWPTAISDNGTIIGSIGQPYFGSDGCFIWVAGEDKPQRYTEAFPTFNTQLGAGDELGMNMPTAISANGRYLLGYVWASTTNFEEDGFWLTYIIDRGELSGVQEIATEDTDAVPTAIYSIDGKKLNGLQKGLNIVHMSDGSARKIMK